MPRIQGLLETNAMVSVNTLLKTGKGYLFSVTITFIGVTAGQYCSFYDDDDGVSGVQKIIFAFPAANGVITKEWANGKEFVYGIFWHKGASNGQVIMECTYK